MDTERIQIICDRYLADYRSTEYCNTSDWRYYIYEATMEAVYGKGIWKKLRQIDKQKEIQHKQKKIEELQAALNNESE